MRRLIVDASIAVIPGQPANLRGHPVLYRQAKQQGVQIDVIRGPPDLEMKMRPLRSAGTAAPRDLIALFDRKERRRYGQIDGPGLQPVLLLLNISRQRGR